VFQEVFKQYHSKLYYFIYSRTNSEYLAEEVVQSTFIKLWKYRESLQDHLSISTQLYRIASTTLIDELRKRKTALTVIKTMQEANVRTFDNSMMDGIDERELLASINETVRQMPPIRRQVFELSRNEGLSYKEIAEKLSISVKTVENHLSKALKFLRKKLVSVVLVVVMYFFLEG
jgi:RNA polymerase sigma-70 factor (ECF subfamily)